MKISNVKHKNIQKIDAPVSKRAEPQAHTSEEESAIDEMAAPRELSFTGMIYGVSEDEVRIVEGKA